MGTAQNDNYQSGAGVPPTTIHSYLFTIKLGEGKALPLLFSLLSSLFSI